jgi:uncharacterized protein YraI
MFKKYKFLLVFSMLMIASCSQINPSTTGEVVLSATATPTQIQQEPTSSVAPTYIPVKQAPSQPTAIPTVTAEDKVALGEVAVDALNLRIGPGTNHPVLRILNKGQELEIYGRNENHDWLLIELPSGTQGWVAAEFVETGTDISALPLREAYGGPYAVQPEQSVEDERKALNIQVNIENNIAIVIISGFPDEVIVFANLSSPDGANELIVATGRTSLNGNASLQFTMPTEWPNGKALKSGELLLTIISQDGTFSLPAKIQYYR